MNVTHIHGDCKNVLSQIPDNSVQLIFTSPPYADARKGHYDGVPIKEYVSWFMDRAPEFQRVLKPRGTFIIVIKERVVAGQRSTYVLELILALQKQGWLWTEEWVWYKKTTAPGKWPNRFRDQWERILQFSRQRHFDMYQDEVMVPIGDWSKSRLAHLSEKDMTRQPSGTGSGFGKNVSNWTKRPMVYPSNVLHLSSETGNHSGHPAAFPVELPSWFIRLFTQSGDTVLDPFSGSGTTGVAAVSLGRHYIGIDTNQDYLNDAKLRIKRAADSQA